MPRQMPRQRQIHETEPEPDGEGRVRRKPTQKNTKKTHQHTNDGRVQRRPGLLLTSMARQKLADSRLPLARSNVPYSSRLKCFQKPGRVRWSPQVSDAVFRSADR